MKTRSLKIRLTEEEHTKLALRAVRRNTTISNLVRAELGLAPGNSDTYASCVATRWPNAKAAGAA